MNNFIAFTLQSLCSLSMFVHHAQTLRSQMYRRFDCAEEQNVHCLLRINSLAKCFHLIARNTMSAVP